MSPKRDSWTHCSAQSALLLPVALSLAMSVAADVGLIEKQKACSTSDANGTVTSLCVKAVNMLMTAINDNYKPLDLECRTHECVAQSYAPACRYALSFSGAFKANLRREYTLIGRHSFVYGFRFTQVSSCPSILCSCIAPYLLCPPWVFSCPQTVPL